MVVWGWALEAGGWAALEADLRPEIRGPGSLEEALEGWRLQARRHWRAGCRRILVLECYSPLHTALERSIPLRSV